MDINGLKPINDSDGHAAGDKLLAEAGRKLRDSLRSYDFVGRIGGDEFIVIGVVVDCLAIVVPVVAAHALIVTFGPPIVARRAEDVDLTSGVCGLGRVTGVFGSNQELIDGRTFDPQTRQIQYSVNRFFGQEDLLGSNLILQFQAQFAFRYFF